MKNKDGKQVVDAYTSRSNGEDKSPLSRLSQSPITYNIASFVLEFWTFNAKIEWLSTAFHSLSTDGWNQSSMNESFLTNYSEMRKLDKKSHI